MTRKELQEELKYPKGNYNSLEKWIEEFEKYSKRLENK
jgi:hypothetical protein